MISSRKVLSTVPTYRLASTETHLGCFIWMITPIMPLQITLPLVPLFADVTLLRLIFFSLLSSKRSVSTYKLWCKPGQDGLLQVTGSSAWFHLRSSSGYCT